MEIPEKVGQFYKDLFTDLFNDRGEEESYKRNDIIHLDGIKGDVVWFIKEGKLKHLFHDIEGYEKTVLILGKGEIFGEITLFQKDMNLVLTQAMENTVVNRIRKEEFLDIFSKNPDYYLYLIESITRKFRIMMYQMKDLSFKSIDGRLANLLLRLSEQQGVDLSRGKAIDLYLTHQELANMIAATRASVTRAINKFIKEKSIRIEHKRIIILDRDKLKKWVKI